MYGKLGLKLFSTVLCAALLTAGLALAQEPPPGGPGTGAGVPPYDKTSETTVKGALDSVKQVDTPSGVKGTRLYLKQGGQTIEIYAGPANFFAKSGIVFTKGEALEVTGSKVDIQGASALLARQIKSGGKTIVVRDENGRPVWARQAQ